MLIVYKDDGRINFISSFHSDEGYEKHLQDLGYLTLDYQGLEQPSDVVASCYVLNGELADRPHITINATEVQSGDEIIIGGLPATSLVVIDDVEHQVTGDKLTFESGDIGEYQIRIDAWPCLPFNQTVVVR
ncbi:hypothetical protein [Ochrobactrum sp. SFR4]|uniref:hypothetical protein n=1 Tax=Ochrobactrum sp. SFR4 TaxID=2717368 RepID=UPI001C8CE0B8|nr:hypothetical protein [Ochrobactrum sp. SFR4]MBX8827260.1 hypothetical protein [Ochrobactrum sp. SFR4]